MDKQISITEFSKQFGTEEKCIARLERVRWPNGIRCLKCNGERISRIKATGKTGKTRSLYLCLDCEYQFSVTVGTIFHDSHVPLTKWFIAIRLMCSAKKGVSAKQLERELAVSYETAWYMGHRIRAAMKENVELLSGIVEVDETYVGGKAKNKHGGKFPPGSGRGRGTPNKTPVLGAISRSGKVVARMIERADKATLVKFVREAVSDKVSLLVTDEWTAYKFLGKTYPHKVINHRKGEYVVGAVHTNTIEGFWSIFKRGIIGSFHKVSKKYLPLYIAEFEFRYNRRKDQASMFDQVLGTCF